MNTMKFMFRDRNKLLTFKLKKLYSFIFNNTYIFHKLKVRTNIKAFYLSTTGPKLWNNLDNCIRNILISFKRTLKNMYLIVTI